MTKNLSVVFLLLFSSVLVGQTRRAPKVWQLQVALSELESIRLGVSEPEEAKLRKAAFQLFLPPPLSQEVSTLPVEVKFQLPGNLESSQLRKLNAQILGKLTDVRVVESGPDGKTVADLTMPATLKSLDKATALFALEPRRFLDRGLKPQLEVVTSKRATWVFSEASGGRDPFHNAVASAIGCASIYPKANGDKISPLGRARLVSPTEVDFDELLTTFFEEQDSAAEYSNLVDKKVVARIIMRDKEQKPVSYFYAVISTTSFGTEFAEEMLSPGGFDATFKFWNTWPSAEDVPVKP